MTCDCIQEYRPNEGLIKYCKTGLRAVREHLAKVPESLAFAPVN